MQKNDDPYSEVLTPVVVSSPGIPESTLGEVRVKTWSDQERRQRAMKMGGILFGIGVFSILIPLAHFVLVPGFIIAAPIVAWIFYGQRSVILGGMAICPHCKKDLKIEQSKHRFPLNDVCSACYREIKVNLK